MFSVINRYIFKSISSGFVLAILIFLTLAILIGFIQQINAVGKGDFTVGSAIYYTALTIPSIIFDYFPVSAVVGIMIGLGALANNSELIVIQSSGISKLKIAWITSMTLIVWLVPMTIIGELIVPPAKLTAESYRSAKLSKNLGLGLNSGVWIRDGNVIFNATPIGNVYDIRSKNIVMNDVTVYELDDDLQVIKVSKAEKATHKDKAWELFNLQVTEFVESGVTTQLIEKQTWTSRIEPELLSITHSRPKYLSIRDIIKYKRFQKNKDNIPAKYDIALWSKVSYPLFVTAIALMGLPFIFGLVRSGGFGARLLVGMMLGIVLYLVNKTLLNMGEVFNVAPFVVATLPSIIILVGVLWYLKSSGAKSQ